MNILGDVRKLVKEYGTSDPYRLLKYLDVKLIKTKLPASTWGFTLTSDNSVAVVINDLLSDNQQRFTVAHELGHVVEHKDVSTSFLRTYCHGCQIPKVEAEANYFAFDLLLFGLKEFGGFYNKFDIVRGLGLSDSMARFIK